MWDFLSQFLKDHGCKVLGGIITPAILYKIYYWCNKKRIEKRIKSFIKDKNGAQEYYKYKFETFSVLNNSNSHVGSNTGLDITFYQYKNIFYNDHNNLQINNDIIPKGYFVFKIKKKDRSIELIYFNDGKIKNTLLMENNVVNQLQVGNTLHHNQTQNPRKFDNILSWN